MLHLHDENGSFLEVQLEVETELSEDGGLSEEGEEGNLREQVQEELQTTGAALEEAERRVTQERAEKEQLETQLEEQED